MANKKNAKKQKRWLTPREAAERLGVSRSSVYRYISLGYLVAYQYTDRTIRISRSALRAFRSAAREQAVFGIAGYARAKKILNSTK